MQVMFGKDITPEAAKEVVAALMKHAEKSWQAMSFEDTVRNLKRLAVYTKDDIAAYTATGRDLGEDFATTLSRNPILHRLCADTGGIAGFSFGVGLTASNLAKGKSPKRRVTRAVVHSNKPATTKAKGAPNTVTDGPSAQFMREGVRSRADRYAATTKPDKVEAKTLLSGPQVGLSERRNLPGVASHGGNLPKVSDTTSWLRGSEGNAAKIPHEIAEKLSGREFRDFNHFRSEFWKEVSKNSKLSSEFLPRNRKLISQGNAPIVKKEQAQGKRRWYELDHNQELQRGGNVYDMNNIIIRTPLNHLKGKM